MVFPLFSLFSKVFVFFVKKYLCKAIYSLLSIKTINFAAEKLYSGRKLAQNRGKNTIIADKKIDL